MSAAPDGSAATPSSAPLSRYFDHLPAIMRGPPSADCPAIDGLLRAVEAVLSGIGDPQNPGLAEIIGGIPAAGLAGQHRYYEPGPSLPDEQRAPTAFLDWLAGWVALSSRYDLPEEVKRDFIARSVSLYRLRGTAAGLKGVLKIYTELEADIVGDGPAMCVGTHATVGVDTRVDGFAPHHFAVRLRVPAGSDLSLAATEAERSGYERIARAIIEAEKPAHCTYHLAPFVHVCLRVGVDSTIGLDTLIGGADDRGQSPMKGDGHGR